MRKMCIFSFLATYMWMISILNVVLTKSPQMVRLCKDSIYKTKKTNITVDLPINMYLQNHIQRTLSSILLSPVWLCPRPISNSQLHALLHFHLCPIYLVVFKGSYYLRMGYLILRGASRLDAFSVYPFPAWLLCYALGRTTDTPAASPSRSSRTKDSSSQISYAHAG